MSQITDHIWVGSYTDACDQQFQRERGITHILCCAEEFPMPPPHMLMGNSTANWHRLPIVDDKRDENTPQHFLDGAAKINEWVKAGHKVMVHCYYGVSRSVSTVMAYLIVYCGYPYTSAFHLVKLRRSIADPHPCYIPILQSFKSKSLTSSEVLHTAVDLPQSKESENNMEPGLP